jgi:hypothetical protein
MSIELSRETNLAAANVKRLRHSLGDFTILASQSGVSLNPFHPDEPSPLGRLPLHTQNQVIDNFSRYLKVATGVVAEQTPLYNTQAFLWRMIRELNLRPSSDLFEQIGPNDVVEIYDHNFIQVFRNLRFMELCSYTLEDVFTHEFPELFARPNEITTVLVEHCQQVFEGRITTTQPTHVPDHELCEIWSSKRKQFSIRQGVISPLYDKTRRPVAVVATLKAEVKSIG